MKQLFTVFTFLVYLIDFTQNPEIDKLYSLAEEYKNNKEYKKAELTYRVVIEKVVTDFGKK